MFENDGLPVMGTMHVITLPRAQRASYSVHQMRRASTAKPDGKNGHQTLPLRIKLMSYLAGIEPAVTYRLNTYGFDIVLLRQLH